MSDKDSDIPTLPEEDRQLFRQTVGPVTALSESSTITPTSPKPSPIPRQLQADEAAVMDELLDHPIDNELVQLGEEIEFLRSGINAHVLRRLKQGRYSVDDEIDLHQMNIPSARDYLIQFLHSAQRKAQHCVRVVHGKGLRSRGQPKLKQMVNHILRRQSIVIAFASCRPVDGGTGAVYVLLRSKP